MLSLVFSKSSTGSLHSARCPIIDKVITCGRSRSDNDINAACVCCRFELFRQPVEEEDAPDYYSIIEWPMDLDTIMTRIDQHR